MSIECYSIWFYFVDSPVITRLGLVGSGLVRNEGDTTSFNCSVDSYPKSNVTWTFRTGNSKTECFNRKKSISYCNITATCLDTGKYQCTASNGIGDKVTNATDFFVRCKYFRMNDICKFLNQNCGNRNIFRC